MWLSASTSDTSALRHTHYIYILKMRIPFGLVRRPWIVNGLLRFFIKKILSELLCACNCCNWLMPRWVACRMAFKLRWRSPRKKCTAGLAKPISEVDPCGDESVAFSSHADNTSSASIPNWTALPIFNLFWLMHLLNCLEFVVLSYRVKLDPNVQFPFAIHKLCHQSSQL